MSKLNYERKGPPRPGSGSVDHPKGIERPYVHVTSEQKRLRREQQKAEAEERGRAIKEAEQKARDAEFEAKFGKLPDLFNGLFDH